MNIAHGLSVNILHLWYISDAFMTHAWYIYSKLERKRLQCTGSLIVTNCFLLDLFKISLVNIWNHSLETNGISWNAAIRCNNNNGSFIFNQADFQPFLHHVRLKPDLQSGQTFDENLFWKLSHWLTIIQRLHEWWQLVTISIKLSRSVLMSKTTTVIKWNRKKTVLLINLKIRRPVF